MILIWVSVVIRDAEHPLAICIVSGFLFVCFWDKVKVSHCSVGCLELEEILLPQSFECWDSTHVWLCCSLWEISFQVPCPLWNWMAVIFSGVVCAPYLACKSPLPTCRSYLPSVRCSLYHTEAFHFNVVLFAGWLPSCCLCSSDQL